MKTPDWQVKKIERWDTVKLPKLLEEFPPRIKEILSKEEFTFLDNWESSRFFTGPSGTGKTVDAFRTFLRWHKTTFCIRRESSFDYVKVPNLLNSLRDAIGSDVEKKKELIHHYKTRVLLILDDLGAINTTDFAGEILYMIIDYRYEQRLTTYYTSNFDLKMLSELMQDDRITRRIASDCLLHYKTFKNEPYV